MKIYLFDQENKMTKHLHRLKKETVMQYDSNLLEEKISTIEINIAKTIDKVNLDFLFAYNIFPKSIMGFKTQWYEERREMRKNDTIAQQVYIPPTKLFSQKIIFGVRIKDVINEANRKGFSYETISGHVEKGISIFTVEQINNKLIFKIHTYSSPGNLLTKLLSPIFSIPYQTFCTNKALNNVKKQIELQ